MSTKDGVNLHCLYYPGMMGKNSFPVILLHDWERQASDFQSLAKGLQERYQCAVIVPDLRGHGASTTWSVPGLQAPRQIRRDRMRRAHIEAMYLSDLEAVKKFLRKKHNEGELNIELLCVVGAEMGAVVAANWARLDWSWPELPTYKQGQDVKVLVLISPPQTSKGAKLMPALTHPSVRSRLSVMIVYGTRNAKDDQSAKKVHRLLQRYHDPEREDLKLVAANSNLRGTPLMNARGLDVRSQIARFIQKEMSRAKDLYPWQPRINPLED